MSLSNDQEPFDDLNDTQSFVLKICFNFAWISLLDLKFSMQFIGWRFNDLSGELDNFYRFNYCIFAFAVGNTVMAEWLIDWLTVRITYGVNHAISMVIVTVVISLSRSLLFLCSISFLIHTYIHKCILCITFDTDLKFPAHR